MERAATPRINPVHARPVPFFASLLTLFAITICAGFIGDGLRSCNPPRSNLSFRGGAYRVNALAAADLLQTAGLEAGDEIVAFNGQPFQGHNDLFDRFRALKPGERVFFSVRRQGQSLDLAAVTRPNLAPWEATRIIVPVLGLLLLGGTVYFFRPHLPGALLFLMACLAIAINDAGQATLIPGSGFWRLILIFSYTMLSLPSAALLLHFFVTFPDRGRLQKILMWFLPAAYGVPLGLGLCYFLPHLFPSLYESPSREVVTAFFRRAHDPVVTACYGLAALSLAAIAWKGPSFRVQRQARILCAGFAAMALLHGFFFELPLLLRRQPLVDPFTYALFDLVLLGSVALAILLHHLFDINVLVRQGLIYAAASVGVAGIFVAVFGLAGWMAREWLLQVDAMVVAVAAALGALAFHPLRLLAQEGVDRLFYRRRYNDRQALTEISTRLAGILETGEAAAFIRSQILRILQPEWIELIVRRNGPPAFVTLVESGPSPVFSEGSNAFHLERLLASHPSPFRPPAPEWKEEPRPALVVPILRGDEVLGAMLLGPRPGDVPYVAADRDVLTTLANLAGTVFERGRLLEERSLRERLALVGSATAAVVHELKNPLAAIKSTAAVLRRRLPEDARGQELTHIIEREIDRLLDNVLNILAYVRPQPLQAVAVDLAELLQQLAGVVEPEFSQAGVEVAFQVEGDVPRVWGDPGRLRQLFLNLLLNSREARVGKGRIDLILRSWKPDPETLRGAEVLVADNGPGFPPEHLNRLFEPFFTTKRLGTGLGLANVRRIAEEHGGQVSASNLPEGGALVTVQLPLRFSGP